MNDEVELSKAYFPCAVVASASFELSGSIAIPGLFPLDRPTYAFQVEVVLLEGSASFYTLQSSREILQHLPIRATPLFQSLLGLQIIIWASAPLWLELHPPIVKGKTFKTTAAL